MAHPPDAPKPKRRMATLRRLFFIGLYLLGLLVFLELAGRLTWLCLDKTWGLLVPQEISRFDDALGWSLTPGARAVSKSTGQPIEYAINTAGFRDRDFPREKPAGVFRILVVGDSHAFGFGVPLDKHFTKLLEGYFTGVEVMNLGVSGYGVDQELLFLRDTGFAYHPDLVVAYVPHYADSRHVRDKVWGMGKPRFLLENGALVLTNSPVANNSLLYRLLIDADRFASSWSKAYLLLRDAVIHFSVQKDQVKAETLPDDLARSVGNGAATTAATADKPAGETAPVAPDAAAAEAEALLAEVNRMGETIVFAMNDESEAHGAKFALVTRIGVLAVAAYNRGIPALYLFDPLQNPRLILAGDPTRHPNEPASGIIAWEIARFLMANGLVPAPHIPQHGIPK
ncbi:SGNH/GDSL hydrolase family protein [Desulfovibrio sulfodismutans]|uniref:SGNH/GDSL hydrolase family protein n=1 Tax=Desulfolutivibrio sulfodismutans TaxID=63561 RepID=A0A7K3NK74_9BACT|nr:SGNH/GDSL hydrolase family protein [Desulfolutivibrio sulfodismutans]NDY56582.1 SGNH/GDSL hydrolase family protein [Desulfolutivibrio sulfodismutans]QLA13040.1 hypothetical protein GD606_12575 [Desulfolutivibrio sulfodismutans DSM 3696]